MMRKKIQIWFTSGMTFYCLATTNLAQAQVVPDATLPNNSSIRSQGNVINILGGTQVGNNLFHSFKQFSLQTNGVAYFNNATAIQNIIGRVTGGSVSNIDGLIKANGTANLFLINPNGIIFGPHASLNIGGSFLGTTANSINFADGTQFSATTPQVTPLLTVSIPIGLDFGNNPSAIQAQGPGHDLIGPAFSPVIRGSNSTTGLRVLPGKTLALVGGDINLDGSILTAYGGSIELGSVNTGSVSISPTTSGWAIAYKAVPSFKDIYLDHKALVDASGMGGSNIQLQGRTVGLTGGSVILIQNNGPLPGGTLKVNASESLEVVHDSDTRITTSLRNETVGPGNGGDVAISTKRVVLRDGGQINNFTFSAAAGGNTTVIASESIQLLGVSPFNPSVFSEIGNATFRSGKAGDLTVSTQGLFARNGGLLTSASFGTGKGGNLTVNATSYVELIGVGGVEPKNITSAELTATALNAGDAGSLTINTSKLLVGDGGRIDSSTLASGKAGSVTINASDSVDVSGTDPTSQVPSLIISSGTINNEISQQLLRLPPLASGNSGNIVINTNKLGVVKGAQITVRNDGTGNAGNLQVNANSINLDSKSGITASTANGLGGNIFLKIPGQLNLDHNSIISATAGGKGSGGNITIDPQTTTISNGSGITVNSTGTGNAGQLKISSNNLILNNGSFLSATTNGGEGGNLFLRTQNLQLDNNSSITASAGGSGNGGNITINTQVLPILDSSFISANAQGGTGGRVTINTQGLFLSPGSTITATSQRGPQFNGIVQINIPTQLNFARASSTPTPPPQSPQVTAVCPTGAGAQSSLVNSGTGGIPLAADSTSNSNAIWQGNSTPVHKSRAAKSKKHSFKRYLPVPATGVAFRPDGTMAFVAASSNTPVGTSSGCTEATISH